MIRASLRAMRKLITVEVVNVEPPRMDDPCQALRNVEDLLAEIREIDEPLQLRPGVHGRTDRICVRAHRITYNASDHGIADLARKAPSEAQEPHSRRIDTYLAHLKVGLERAKRRLTSRAK